MNNAATFEMVFPPFTQHSLRERSLHFLATDLKKKSRSIIHRRHVIATWKMCRRS